MDRLGRGPGDIIAAVAGGVGTGVAARNVNKHHQRTRPAHVLVGHSGEIAGGHVGGVGKIGVAVGGGGGEGGGGGGGEGLGGLLGRGEGDIDGPGHVLRLSVGVEDTVEGSKEGNWRGGHLVAIGGGLEVRVNCSK